MSFWQPFEPSSACPWDAAAASHLLRRAGFCASLAEIERTLDEGCAATVRRLVEVVSDSPSHAELDEIGADIARRDDIADLRGWWLRRMCVTIRPLHARISVLWHGHFATSNAKVRSAPLMLQQLRTIERHALGKFDDMVLALSRDPAMIDWLDGNENCKGRPNENFARELFELFTLGIGNYSESDVREAARAFTGWHTRNGVFHFSEPEHDHGDKSVLGSRGNLNGADVVRIAASTKHCRAFLARKLLAEFLCPEPPTNLVDALTEELLRNDLRIGDTLRTLLASREFFEPRWRRVRIKSPVEFVVGMQRSLGAQFSASELSSAVAQMGQRLFEPPTVKGWDGHRSWVSAASLLVRINAASRAADNTRSLSIDAPIGNLQEDSGTSTETRCARLTLDRADLTGGASAADRAALVELRGAEHLRAVLRLCLTSPEYQMA